jgi:hypothetical protein
MLAHRNTSSLVFGLGVAIALAGAAAAVGATAIRPPAATASAAPAAIGPKSSAADVIDFAQTSAGRWRTLTVTGHTVSGGRKARFRAWVRGSAQSRLQVGTTVRVRDGLTTLLLDTARRTAVRTPAARMPAATRARIAANMAVHRAEDPTLARPGELLIASPVNDLVSPSYFLRRELECAATSVRNAGAATVAGREAIVLTVRFPAELAKEDHWDVYVDRETGILLGFAIEPLPGQSRYETFLDSVRVDAAIATGTLSAQVPASYTEVRR